MSLLRILAPAGEDQPLDWVRLDRHYAILDTGRDFPSVAPEDDSTVELIIPAERSALIRVTLTPEHLARLSDDNLQWLIEPHVGQDIEQLHVARGDVDAVGNLTVFTVDREWLANTLRSLAEKQIRPDRILLEILLQEWQPETWRVVIKPSGGFVRTGEQSALILDLQPGDTPPLVLQMALRNLPPPTKILAMQTGDTGMIDPSRWSQTLGLPVQIASGTDWRQARPGKTIDLARGRFAPPSQASHIARRLKLAGVLLAGIAAINVLGAGIKTILQSVEKHRLESGIEAVLIKTLPGTTVILDPVLQMQKHLDRQNMSAGIAGPNDFLPLVHRLHKSIGPQISGKITAIDFQAGQRLDLTVADSVPASALTSTLQASGFLAESLAGGTDQQASRIRIKFAP